MSSVPIQIDHHGSIPIRDQIVEAYAQAIIECTLKPGSRLPSIRALAARLKVSPATIAASYRELVERALVTASPRSSFCVSLGGTELTSPGLKSSRRIYQLNRIEPDLRIHPVQEFIRMLPAVAAKDLSIGGYEDYRGYRGLREALADLDRADGVVTNPETEMLITSGAQQAITLIARCFGTNAKVAIEDPCFPGARIAFRNSGADILPVASTNDGLDPSALKAIAIPGTVSVLYCCPTYGNPRGWSWSEDARVRVLEAARTGGFMIIEDDFLGDLDYLAEKPRRLAGHAAEFPDVKVVRIRTFSKCLLPTLRLAGVSGNSAFINKLLSQKVADDIGSSALLQRGLAQFIREGRYEAHLERVRPRYRATREALRSALAASSPAGALSLIGDASASDGLRFDDPPAGLSLLGYLPPELDPARFIAECEKDGVIVMSGRDYWFDGANGRHSFRIGFGALTSEEAVTAVGFFHNALVRAREYSVDHSLI